MADYEAIERGVALVPELKRQHSVLGHKPDFIKEAKRKQLNTIIAALTAAGEMVGEKHIGTYRHRKRGTTYDLVGGAFLQTDEPISDMQALIIYQGKDGQLWARPKHEFEDGRFEYIADTAALAAIGRT